MIKDKSPALSLDREMKNQLKVQPMNGPLWIRLAEFYRAKRDFFRAEICYQAALYHGMDDKDLVSRWLGVFCLNRTYKTKDEVQQSAKIIESAIIEDLAAPGDRVLNHMQFSLACLDNPKLATVCL